MPQQPSTRNSRPSSGSTYDPKAYDATHISPRTSGTGSKVNPTRPSNANINSTQVTVTVQQYQHNSAAQRGVSPRSTTRTNRQPGSFATPTESSSSRSSTKKSILISRTNSNHAAATASQIKKSSSPRQSQNLSKAANSNTSIKNLNNSNSGPSSSTGVSSPSDNQPFSPGPRKHATNAANGNDFNDSQSQYSTSNTNQNLWSRCIVPESKFNSNQNLIDSPEVSRIDDHPCDQSDVATLFSFGGAPDSCQQAKDDQDHDDLVDLNHFPHLQRAPDVPIENFLGNLASGFGETKTHNFEQLPEGRKSGLTMSDHTGPISDNENDISNINSNCNVQNHDQLEDVVKFGHSTSGINSSTTNNISNIDANGKPLENQQQSTASSSQSMLENLESMRARLRNLHKTFDTNQNNSESQSFSQVDHHQNQIRNGIHDRNWQIQASPQFGLSSTPSNSASKNDMSNQIQQLSTLMEDSTDSLEDVELARMLNNNKKSNFNSNTDQVQNGTINTNSSNQNKFDDHDVEMGDVNNHESVYQHDKIANPWGGLTTQKNNSNSMTNFNQIQVQNQIQQTPSSSPQPPESNCSNETSDDPERARRMLQYKEMINKAREAQGIQISGSKTSTLNGSPQLNQINSNVDNEFSQSPSLLEKLKGTKDITTVSSSSYDKRPPVLTTFSMDDLSEKDRLLAGIRTSTNNLIMSVSNGNKTITNTHSDILSKPIAMDVENDDQQITNTENNNINKQVQEISDTAKDHQVSSANNHINNNVPDTTLIQQLKSDSPNTVDQSSDKILNSPETVDGYCGYNLNTGTLATGSPDSAASLLNFLNQVDHDNQNDNRMNYTNTNSSNGHWHNLNDNSAISVGVNRNVKQFQSSSDNNNNLDLDTKLEVLDVELQDKRETIQALRKALQQQQDRFKKLESDIKIDYEKKIESHKHDSENQLNRQLQLCDRLLKEKNELTIKLTSVADELKNAEKKFSSRLDECREMNNKEMQRQKNAWITAERLRREAWEKERTVEIKKLTIKGLEPEVERLLETHRNEKKRILEKYEIEKQELKMEIEVKYEKREKELKESLQKDIQRQLDRERERQHDLISDESEKFEKSLGEERRRCAGKIREMEKILEDSKMMISDGYEKRIKELNERNRMMVQDKTQEYESDMEVLKKKHQEYLDEYRTKLEQEKREDSLKNEEKFEERFKQRETELKQQLTKERDHQLEILATRMVNAQGFRLTALDSRRQRSTATHNRKSESKLSQLSESNDSDRTCVLCCQENTANVCFVPCGHFVYCTQCVFGLRAHLSNPEEISSELGGTGNTGTESDSELQCLQLQAFYDEYDISPSISKSSNLDPPSPRVFRPSRDAITKFLLQCPICRSGSLTQEDDVERLFMEMVRLEDIEQNNSQLHQERVERQRLTWQQESDQHNHQNQVIGNSRSDRQVNYSIDNIRSVSDDNPDSISPTPSSTSRRVRSESQLYGVDRSYHRTQQQPNLNFNEPPPNFAQSLERNFPWQHAEYQIQPELEESQQWRSTWRTTFSTSQSTNRNGELEISDENFENLNRNNHQTFQGSSLSIPRSLLQQPPFQQQMYLNESNNYYNSESDDSTVTVRNTRTSNVPLQNQRQTQTHNNEPDSEILTEFVVRDHANDFNSVWHQQLQQRTNTPQLIGRRNQNLNQLSSRSHLPNSIHSSSSSSESTNTEETSQTQTLNDMTNQNQNTLSVSHNSLETIQLQDPGPRAVCALYYVGSPEKLLAGIQEGLRNEENIKEIRDPDAKAAANTVTIASNNDNDRNFNSLKQSQSNHKFVNQNDLSIIQRIIQKQKQQLKKPTTRSVLIEILERIDENPHVFKCNIQGQFNSQQQQSQNGSDTLAKTDSDHSTVNHENLKKRHLNIKNLIKKGSTSNSNSQVQSRRGSLSDASTDVGGYTSVGSSAVVRDNSNHRINDKYSKFSNSNHGKNLNGGSYSSSMSSSPSQVSYVGEVQPSALTNIFRIRMRPSTAVEEGCYHSDYQASISADYEIKLALQLGQKRRERIQKIIQHNQQQQQQPKSETKQTQQSQRRQSFDEIQRRNSQIEKEIRGEIQDKKLNQGKKKRQQWQQWQRQQGPESSQQDAVGTQTDDHDVTESTNSNSQTTSVQQIYQYQCPVSGWFDLSTSSRNLGLDQSLRSLQSCLTARAVVLDSESSGDYEVENNENSFQDITDSNNLTGRTVTNFSNNQNRSAQTEYHRVPLGFRNFSESFMMSNDSQHSVELQQWQSQQRQYSAANDFKILSQIPLIPPLLVLCPRIIRSKEQSLRTPPTSLNFQNLTQWQQIAQNFTNIQNYLLAGHSVRNSYYYSDNGANDTGSGFTSQGPGFGFHPVQSTQQQSSNSQAQGQAIQVTSNQWLFLRNQQVQGLLGNSIDYLELNNLNQSNLDRSASPVHGHSEGSEGPMRLTEFVNSQPSTSFNLVDIENFSTEAQQWNSSNRSKLNQIASHVHNHNGPTNENNHSTDGTGHRPGSHQQPQFTCCQSCCCGHQQACPRFSKYLDSVANKCFLKSIECLIVSGIWCCFCCNKCRCFGPCQCGIDNCCRICNHICFCECDQLLMRSGQSQTTTVDNAIWNSTNRIQQDHSNQNGNATRFQRFCSWIFGPYEASDYPGNSSNHTQSTMPIGNTNHGNMIQNHRFMTNDEITNYIRQMHQLQQQLQVQQQQQPAQQTMSNLIQMSSSTNTALVGPHRGPPRRDTLDNLIVNSDSNHDTQMQPLPHPDIFAGISTVQQQQQTQTQSNSDYWAYSYQNQVTRQDQQQQSQTSAISRPWRGPNINNQLQHQNWFQQQLRQGPGPQTHPNQGSRGRVRRHSNQYHTRSQPQSYQSQNLLNSNSQQHGPSNQNNYNINNSNFNSNSIPNNNLNQQHSRLNRFIPPMQLSSVPYSMSNRNTNSTHSNSNLSNLHLREGTGIAYSLRHM